MSNEVIKLSWSGDNIASRWSCWGNVFAIHACIGMTSFHHYRFLRLFITGYLSGRGLLPLLSCEEFRSQALLFWEGTWDRLRVAESKSHCAVTAAIYLQLTACITRLVFSWGCYCEASLIFLLIFCSSLSQSSPSWSSYYAESLVFYSKHQNNLQVPPTY